MQNLLIQLKTVPGEAWLVLSLFLGATVHAIRRKAVSIAEGLTGAVISFVGGFYLFKIGCYMLGITLDDVWFLGFPVAYMSNYGLGGMDTVGAEIRDSPVKTIISVASAITDEVLERYFKIKERFNPQPPK